MKIICSQEELLDALHFIVPIASGRTSLPILQTIRFEAKGSQLGLMACDGEMWASKEILAKVEEEGSVCVSAKLLTDVVSSLPHAEVYFELSDNALFLKQNDSEWRMLALDSKDFPEIPAARSDSNINLKYTEILEGIQNIAYATADDTSRPVLTGILFQYDGHCLTLVATDTHRLAVRHIHKEGIGSNINAIVPHKALKTLKFLPLEEEDSLNFEFDTHRLYLNAGSCRIVTQLLAGNFPNWHSVIPKEVFRSWTFERQDLLNHVKRAMILARDTANRIKFKGLEGQIQISARSEDKGEAKEFITAVCKNGNIDVAFNGRYILDTLNSLPSDGIRAEFTEPSRPVIFKGVEDGDNLFCVIMPMALS